MVYSIGLQILLICNFRNFLGRATFLIKYLLTITQEKIILGFLETSPSFYTFIQIVFKDLKKVHLYLYTFEMLFNDMDSKTSIIVFTRMILIYQILCFTFLS